MLLQELVTDDLAAAKLANLKKDRRAAIMLAMWQRMADYLGPKWERAYGSARREDGSEGSAFHAWSRTLEGYEESDIGAAITACQRWADFDPPTIADFLSMVGKARQDRALVAPVADLRIAHKPDATVIEHLAQFGVTPVALAELDRMRRSAAGDEVETKAESMRILKLGARWHRGV
jgi:hypothetical protein